MMYYVIEIQTLTESGSIIPFGFTDRAEAEAKYHTLLSVAAVSSIPKHGAMLFNADGFVLKSEVYNHEDQAD